MEYSMDMLTEVAKLWNTRDETRLSLALRYGCTEVQISYAIDKCRKLGIYIDDTIVVTRHRVSVTIMCNIVEFTRQGITVNAISRKLYRSERWVERVFRQAQQKDIMRCRSDGLQLVADTAKPKDDEAVPVPVLDFTVNGSKVSWVKVRDDYIALPYLRCLDASAPTQSDASL